MLVVERVLLVHFLACAGADHTRGIEAQFLGLDAGGEVISLLHFHWIHPALNQTLPLYSAKRMAGEYEGAAEHRSDLPTYVARIRIVGVDQIRYTFFPTQVGKRAIDEGIEVPPDNLLAQIAARAGLYSDDVRIVIQDFPSLCIVIGKLRIKNPPSEQRDSPDSFVLGECLDQFQCIQALPACIRIAPKLHLLAADQAVDGDVQKIQFAHFGEIFVRAHKPVGGCCFAGMIV